MSILAALPQNARAAVLRLRSLGDCVLTTPALHILKAARPDLQIAVVVEDRFRDVFTGNPDVAAVLPPSVPAVRGWRPELCINLHGGTRSMALTAASGAKFRAGFRHFRGSGIYNVTIPTAQEIMGVDRKVHTAEHLASAMFALGAPQTEIPRARLFAEPVRRRGPYAVMHPVAATPEKTWPAENFMRTAGYLRDDHGIETVFIAGPGDDLTPFQAFETRSGAPLEQTESLISGASLFIGNDSGPAHIAAAFGVPVVVIFGPSDSVVWAPWRVPSQVLQADPISGVPVTPVCDAAANLLQATVAR